MRNTFFITPWGTYCQVVMPFGLQNARTTYQKTVTTLLYEVLHNEAKVHVDDMIIKSKDRARHTLTPQKFFARLRKFNMFLDP